MRLADKVAVITGAGSGMGRAMAEMFAAEGAKVVCADISGKQDDVAAAIGSAAVSVYADVADEVDVQNMIAAAEQRFGRLDILVNNAGAAPENPAERVVEEDFDQTLAVNLKGTFFACQAAGRVMIGQGGGRIVNMGSQAGAVALPGESVYCMTKAAIAHLTRCLAVEWGPHGINVNCVAPTFIRTPGTEEALADPNFEADVVERIAALHRIGEPMDVAGAVLYLCSPAAALVTGHTLMVDGGWTAR